MPDQVQEIKASVDIVNLIGERVRLSRGGKNFKGLCPFHSEKSPSFFVSPDIQMYKCFGCGKAGDVFSFLQEYDSFTFAEALQVLADRAGIVLEKKQFSKEDTDRQRLLEALHFAKEYYHYLLTEHEAGKEAREYLKNRGVRQETIKTFQIGYSLDSWDGVQKYLIGKKGFSVHELERVGLVLKASSGNRYYDRFRGRIIFPLTDPRSRVVGFSGRVLDPKIKEAKYINSPETEFYHKSELLFGYSQLHSFIREKEEVVVTEGEFDAISSYQAEVKHVVAIKGSALTEQHVKLLSRSVKRIILSLDADSAGIAATKRAIEVAKPYDLHLRVINIEGGKDPDEIARTSPKGWREMVKSSVSIYEFLINAALKGKDLSTGEGKSDATREIVPVLASIENVVEQAHYITFASEKLGVKEELFEIETRKYFAKNRMGSRTYKKKEEKVENSQVFSRQEILERYILGLLMLSSDVEAIGKVSEDMFVTPSHIRILKAMKEASSDKGLKIQEFMISLPEELQTIAGNIYLELQEQEAVDDPIEHLEKAVKDLEMCTKATMMKAFAERMKQLEKKDELTNEEQKEFEELQKQFVHLT